MSVLRSALARGGPMLLCAHAASAVAALAAVGPLHAAAFGALAEHAGSDATLTTAAFTAILLGTSSTLAIEVLRPSQLGSMLIGVLWLAGATALWWPVLRRDGRQLRYMAAVAYLFVPFILPKLPGLVYILEARPVYQVYADAPRVAGLTMSVVGTASTRAASLASKIGARQQPLYEEVPAPVRMMRASGLSATGAMNACSSACRLANKG